MLVRSLTLSLVLTAISIIAVAYFPQYWTLTTIAAALPVRFALFWWAGCSARRAATDEIFGIGERVLKEEQARRQAARQV